MYQYFIRRICIMGLTLVVISALVFIIIQLPPGDYLTTYIEELKAQGEVVDPKKITFLRSQYGLDQPMTTQYFVWLTGMLQGDFGYSFEYDLPVTDVVGDRMWLSMILNFATVLFVYMMSFPIGVYSATHQYSWGDHGLTFIGFLGLATPNFLLALILLYFANVWFGTSIGGLMESEFIDQPTEREGVVQTNPRVSGLRHVEILATGLCIVRKQSWPSAESEKICHGHNLVHEEHRRGGSCEPSVYIR